MKKILSAALTLCLLLSLAACGGNEGVTILNELEEDIQDIYIVPAGAPAWDEDVVGYVNAGVGAYWYPEEIFGQSKLDVDMKFVDTMGNIYEFYNVAVKDGDAFYIKIDEEGDALLIENDVDELYIGTITPGVNITGVWESTTEDGFILFYEDLTWEAVTSYGEVVNSGDYALDSGTVEITMEDSGFSLSLEDDGTLVSEADDLHLAFLCEFATAEYDEFIAYLATGGSYFEKMGYPVDYCFGDGDVYQENGAMAMANAGLYYARIPVYTNLELDSYNDTGDGYVEIEFTKTAYIDINDFPDFIYEVERYDYGINCGLYDSYTGCNLPASPTYGNTSRGDNYFYFEYESQGRTICVDYNFSTKWTKDSDGSKYCVSQIFIRMPADYDGLVYGIIESREDFAAFAANNTEDKTIALIEDVEAENAVFCRINDLQ